MKKRSWPKLGLTQRSGRNVSWRSYRSNKSACRVGRTRPQLERLEPRQLLAGEPVITEFLARNDGGLKDADGRSPDWIEIFNAGDAPIDLQGYHLTDKPTQLDQWTFPSVMVDPGGYLVVFASGQERPDFVDSDGNLHTNFTLKRGGDYLALVAPDKSVVSEFGTGGQNFPEQLTNVSYGIAQGTTLLTANSSGTYLVPGGGNVDGVWTGRDFDALANGFMPGTAALGLEARPNDRTNFTDQFDTVLPDTAHAVYARFEFHVGDASAVSGLNMRLKYDNGFVAYLNGVKVAEDNAPPNASWFSVAPEAPRRDSEVLNFVQFDISQHRDALVDGKNVLAIHVLNNANDGSDMLLVAELMAAASDLEAAFGTPARVGYLTSFTPGAPNPSNDAVFSGFVADTKFTVDRGFFDSPQQVEITTATEGAAIYFTTNGSTPGPSNPSASVYSGPITIDSTTTLRAAGYKDDFMPSNADTQTYLFMSDVVQQDFPAALEAGFPETWGRIPAEYGLDAKVIGPDDLFNGKFAARLVESLEALPTLSLVTDFENLFGASGILTNTQRSGLEWERPASMELINPDGSDGFQIDAGIRIQGDASRDYSNAKKLSFRLAFRKQYGDTKLVYPLFGDGATDQFDTIRLRANYNDGSVHTPLSTQQMRDEWMRRTLSDMGQPNPHGTFMHVYINGIYWGFYNVVERPDGSFSETYFGGDKDDWDTISASAAKNGSIDAWRLLGVESGKVDAADQETSNAAYQRLLGNNPDGTNNRDLEQLLDVDNYIDYLIVNFYGGNGDWPGRNYYAGRLRGPESTGFKFFSWDAEKVLGHEEGATVTANLTGANSDVALFYRSLRTNDEFRLRFADRVQRHFFNGGALYVDPDNPNWDPEFPERNVPAERYDELARLIELPLVAELARWGDTSRRGADKLRDGSDRLITPDDWASFRDGLYADYFPRRSQIVLEQLRRAGLYPGIAAPELNQHGGVVATSFDIQFSTPQGTTYFTTDGSDPRVFGGAVSDQGIQYTEPLRLTEDTQIKARVLHDGQWSALTEARFLIASEFPLRITEINYNPHQANPVAGLSELEVGNDRFEFVEVRNVSQRPVDLEGVKFVQTDINGDDQGIRFTFAAQSLAAGEHAVVVRDRLAFQSRFGNSVRIAAGKDAEDGNEGEFGGRLSNSGEQLTLLDNSGQVIHQFIYRTIGRTDGSGSSLEIVNPAGSYSDRANWRASSEFGGSPGAAGAGPRASAVLFNELLTNSDAPSADQVELYNASPADVAISGWYISDTANDYFKSKINSAAVISAFDYHILSQNDIGFGLNGARGGQLLLVSADANGGPLHFKDLIQYPPSAQGVTLGPWPTRGDAFIPLSESTFGGPNSGPRVGEVIISEVYYNPADPDGPGGTNVRDLEFVELYNTTDSPIDLAQWQLTGDVAFELAEAVTIESGGTVVVVGFNPADDANKSTVFRFTLGINSSVPLVGQLSDPSGRRDRSGVLSDEGGLIQLVRRGDPSTDDPDFVPMLVMDQIEYGVRTPWAESPAGAGDSLTRTQPEDYGPLAISWVGAAPTPGSTAFFERMAGDANDDGQFDQADITQVLQSGKYDTGQPAGWFDGDWNGDGLFDRLDIVEALQAGRYLQGPLASQQDWLKQLADGWNNDSERLLIDAAFESNLD